MNEYQKIFEHLQKVAAHHRFEADVCDQNILLIETLHTALEDLHHRVEILEKQSPYDTPEDLFDCSLEIKHIKERLHKLEFNQTSKDLKGSNNERN